MVKIAQDILDIGRADRLREQHQAHVQTLSQGQPRGRGQQAPANTVPVPLPPPPASPSAASTRDKGDNKSWAKGDNKGSGKGSGQGSGQRVNGSASHEWSSDDPETIINQYPNVCHLHVMYGTRRGCPR